MTTHGAAPHPPRFDCLPGEAKNTMNAPDTRKSLHHLRPRCSPLAVAIVAGLLSPAPAFAQDAPPAKAPASQPTALDTIVVTAPGREEAILAVPSNISAVPAANVGASCMEKVCPVFVY